MVSSVVLRALVAQWLLAGSAYASAWTVTAYYAVTVTTSTDTAYYNDVYTYTDTLTIKPTADVTASAVSTYTSIDTDYDIKRVDVYYDPTDVDSSDYVPTTTYDDAYYSTYSYTTAPYTYYYQEIVYTAPASCPTSFTLKTYTNVYVPTEVVDQVTPKSITTAVSTYADGDKYTIVTAFLSEGEVSLTTDASSTDFIESYYLASCRNPTATGDAYWGGDDDNDGDDTSSSGGGSSSGDSDYYGYRACSVITGCVTWRTWVIVIATVIPGIFLLGFVESYLWFRRLMLGKGALRFGTICWICTSLLVACFTRHTPARNFADRPALRAQWAAMTVGRRIKLWFKWGFRHAYPVELLGPDPRMAAVGKPGDGTPPPQMNAQGQMMQYMPYPQYVQYPQYPMNTQQPMNMQYQQYPVYMQQQNMQPPTTVPSTMDTPSPLNTPPPVHQQNTTNTQAPATTPSPLYDTAPYMTSALHSEPPVSPERSGDAPADGQVAPHQQPPPREQ
ncbi:hypothetical protein AK830_g10029 [Neonectria ditissima]|uniref:Mid2 domain-containing protein n=1 Tax=Neonectria ditissima TaxID=78410 RepID=A0A0P7BB78_9HYPO|nr:hypothetical protein AK830_g10029 [Neonectria ditissima]